MSRLSLLLAFTVALLSAANGHTKPETEQGEPFRLQLRRERVPVTRKGSHVAFKTSYSGLLRAGTPKQDFRVLFDTASGHVILPSQACRSKACLQKRRYNSSASASARVILVDGSDLTPGESSDQATIGFGTGEITGEFVDEQVCLLDGGVSSEMSASRCIGMNMVTAVKMSQEPFAAFEWDGILGLGLAGLSLSQNFSFLHRWVASTAAAPQIAFFLNEGDDGEVSEVTLGGHDVARSLEPLVWSPVARQEQGFWQVEILAVRVGGVELDLCRSGGCYGVFDTGTSHLGVPAPHDKELAALLTVPAIDGDFDCRLAHGPTLEIELAGINLTLPPAHYMRRMPLRPGVRLAGMTGDEAAKSAASRSGRHCRPKVMPVKLSAPLGPKLFILGEPILHRYYTAYDWQSQQIGLGLANSKANLQTLARHRSPEPSKSQVVEEADYIMLLQKPAHRRPAV